MKLEFMHYGKARPLREVKVLRAHERLDMPFSTRPGDAPRATLACGGVKVHVGRATPCDGLASRVEQVGGDANVVETVEGVAWIGEDLLLLRLAMVNPVRGEMFERCVVLDCAREEVECLLYDLHSPPGELVYSIRSSDTRHLWLQRVRVQGAGSEARQMESSDGAVVELHRVPLSRLLSMAYAPSRLYGPLTCVYAPSAFMMTGGDRTCLAPGELALFEDVEVGENGALNFVTTLGLRQLDGADMHVLGAYELALDVEGRWHCEELFGTLDDEQWMIF